MKGGCEGTATEGAAMAGTEFAVEATAAAAVAGGDEVTATGAVAGGCCGGG